jgi:hypothetical protein
MEQAVHSDVVEGHLALDEFQMLLKICSQGFGNAPTTDAYPPIRLQRFAFLATVYPDFIVAEHFYDSSLLLKFILKPSKTAKNLAIKLRS